ncbi:MAG TPA: hypothetical protein VF073_01505 [Gaiella sp.]
MRVVARPDAREVLLDRGEVHVRPRAFRCCRGHQYVLEASFDRPDGDYELVHASDGFRVYASTGLIEPDELHFELDRKGRIQAYWNGQGWIG